MFYPLAGDSDTEVEEWVGVVRKAIAGEVEESDGPSELLAHFVVLRGETSARIHTE